MLEKSEIRGAITATWKAAGLTGRGRRWTYVGPEIEWLLSYEGNWLGRISMLADARFRDAGDDDYPLRVFAESRPTIDGHELLIALAADSNMSDEVRGHVLRDSAQALADFATLHGTMNSLQAAYRSGSLNSMSIRFDLREALEQDG